MMSTFGFPQTSYKNESILNKVENAYAFEERDGNAFTFKDVCVENSNNIGQVNDEVLQQQQQNYQV